MKSFDSLNLSLQPLLLCVISISLLCLTTQTIAQQEANVLGLPAIPQAKPGSSPTAATGTNAASPKPGAAAQAAPANRDLLSGELGIQHRVLDGVGRVVYTTRSTFGTAGAASNALDAARAVQRDLALSCGKQCKPQKMAAPKILSSGQLEFEIAFSPIYQHLSQAQFLAALQSKPFNLTPAQIAAPATPSAAAPATASPSNTATQ